MDPLSPLAAHESPTAALLLTHLPPPQEHHVPYSLYAVSFVSSLARSLVTALVKLVSIFPRQSQKFWEAMTRLSFQRMMKDND